MLASIYAELGESATDIAGMAMMGELAAKNGDGRAMVMLGEYAYARGLPLDYYAYPMVGLPDYQPIAPPIEAGGRLFDRAPGEPLQPEGRLERQCHGPDAGDAGRGHRYSRQVQGHL